MKDPKKVEIQKEIPGYAEDFHIYSLGKDIDGVKHSIADLHVVLLEMLVMFDQLCRKNNIGYALAFGSALGIINYGGFIPWDDDVDIAVDYHDIPRLIEVLKDQLPSDYYFHCYEMDKGYNVLIPTIKIRKKASYLKEKNHYRLPNHCPGDGIFIDIVAFMGVPEKKKEHQKVLRFAKKRLLSYVFQDAILHRPILKMKQDIKDYERHIADQYIDSPAVAQTVIIPFQDWFFQAKNLSYPREVIYPFKEYDFAGHRFYSFNNVSEFCRLKFGEKCFNVWDGEKWVNKYPQHLHYSKHFVKYSLTHARDINKKDKASK